MKVQHSRQVPGGGFGHMVTETKVEELPDKDGDGGDTAVPTGAVKVDDATAVHDWQRPTSTNGMPGGVL